MISFWNRKLLLSLAFVLYFSIYAISPLLCNGAKQNSPQDFPATKNSSAYRADLHIFIYDLICSTFLSKNRNETPKPFLGGILFLKKRAVLSDDKVSNLIRLSDIVVLDDQLLFPSNPPISIAILLQHHASDNFLNQFSGLSPPQAA